MSTLKNPYFSQCRVKYSLETIFNFFSVSFFAKFDLLPIDNGSEKGKVAKDINHSKFFERYW